MVSSESLGSETKDWSGCILFLNELARPGIPVGCSPVLLGRMLCSKGIGLCKPGIQELLSKAPFLAGVLGLMKDEAFRPRPPGLR